MTTIASRAKALVAASSRTQADVAAAIGMTPDAFSRALNGSRGFGALELADLARELDADLHRLITGEPDPSHFLVSARHGYNHSTGERTVDSLEADQQLLEGIRLVYQQAQPFEPSPALPRSIPALRDGLGPAFPRDLIEKVELLGVDVIRLEEVGTAWSGSLLGRNVIIVPTSTNWFRQNWDLAHELGHLVLGHEGVAPGVPTMPRSEADANTFAAELLLPEQLLKDFVAQSPTAGDVANLLWETGVSTPALLHRLDNLQLPLPQDVRDVLGENTQRVLRKYGSLTHEKWEVDPVTHRMEAANSRRFPVWLTNTHTERIAEGSLARGSLAWMLSTSPDDLVVDEPESDTRLSTSELEALLG